MNPWIVLATIALLFWIGFGNLATFAMVPFVAYKMATEKESPPVKPDTTERDNCWSRGGEWWSGSGSAWSNPNSHWCRTKDNCFFENDILADPKENCTQAEIRYECAERHRKEPTCDTQNCSEQFAQKDLRETKRSREIEGACIEARGNSDSFDVSSIAYKCAKKHEENENFERLCVEKELASK